MDLGNGSLHWDVEAERYVWSVIDPFARLFPARFYRIQPLSP